MFRLCEHYVTVNKAKWSPFCKNKKNNTSPKGSKQKWRRLDDMVLRWSQIRPQGHTNSKLAIAQQSNMQVGVPMYFYVYVALFCYKNISNFYYPWAFSIQNTTFWFRQIGIKSSQTIRDN